MITILVCYNNNSTSENYKRLLNTQYFRLNLKTVIIVNTKFLTADILDCNGMLVSTKRIPLANEEMEFSGYYEGIKFAFYEFGEISEVLFLNDTVFGHGKLRKSETIALQEYILRRRLCPNNLNDKKRILGFLHRSSYLDKVFNFHEYINSKFFIITNLSLSEYERLFNIGNIDVSLCVVSGYRNNIYTSDGYSDFLKSWLNEGGWYKSNPLTINNLDFYRSKARSIVHEHYMSDPNNNLFDSIECILRKSFMISIISKITGFSY